MSDPSLGESVADALMQADEKLQRTAAEVGEQVTTAVRHADSAAQKAADDIVDQLAGITVDGEVDRFDLDGATIIIEQHGSGDALYVLVHGIGMGRSVFGDLVAHLQSHGRVWTIDLPGYGETPEPPRTPTIARMADTVAAYLHSRDVTGATLVGHSMGTQVVASLAVRHPDLVGDLVLAAPTVDDQARHILTQFWRLLSDLQGESYRVLLLGAREYLRAGPHLGMKMKAMITDVPEKIYPDIAAPTLVLRGQTDPVSPRAWSKKVVDLIPDATYMELEAHGHETLIRDGKPATEAILEWQQDRATS